MQSFTGLDSIATLRVALRMLSCASTCSRTRGAALAAAWQRLVHGIGIFAPWARTDPTRGGRMGCAARAQRPRPRGL